MEFPCGIISATNQEGIIIMLMLQSPPASKQEFDCSIQRYTDNIPVNQVIY